MRLASSSIGKLEGLTTALQLSEIPEVDRCHSKFSISSASISLIAGQPQKAI
jgi:hypothetical protein